jgi:hypothetical protein
MLLDYKDVAVVTGAPPAPQPLPDFGLAFPSFIFTPLSCEDVLGWVWMLTGSCCLWYCTVFGLNSAAYVRKESSVCCLFRSIDQKTDQNLTSSSETNILCVTIPHKPLVIFFAV